MNPGSTYDLLSYPGDVAAFTATAAMCRTPAFFAAGAALPAGAGSRERVGHSFEAAWSQFTRFHHASTYFARALRWSM